MEKKIITSGKYWICENMDNLAPIIEEGTEYLLSDGSRVKVPYGKENQFSELQRANEQEKKAFASQEYGTIFKGDEVIIKRGRKMVGETKIVKGYYKYVVPNTYGKQYIEYLLFEDGTKCNLLHCDVVGVEHKNLKYRGEILIHRSYEEKINILTFNVGGRI